MSAYQYKPLRYFSVTFLVTFAFFFAGAYLSFQDEDSGRYMFLLLAGLFTPFVVALAMIFSSKDAVLKKRNPAFGPLQGKDVVGVHFGPQVEIAFRAAKRQRRRKISFRCFDSGI